MRSRHRPLALAVILSAVSVPSVARPSHLELRVQVPEGPLPVTGPDRCDELRLLNVSDGRADGPLALSSWIHMWETPRVVYIDAAGRQYDRTITGDHGGHPCVVYVPPDHAYGTCISLGPDHHRLPAPGWYTLTVTYEWRADWYRLFISPNQVWHGALSVTFPARVEGFRSEPHEACLPFAPRPRCFSCEGRCDVPPARNYSGRDEPPVSDLTLSVALPRRGLYQRDERCIDVRLYNASHLAPHLNREDRPDALMGHPIMLVAALVPGITLQLSLRDQAGQEHEVSGRSPEDITWQHFMRLGAGYLVARCVPIESTRLAGLPPGPYLLWVRYAWEASWPGVLFRGLRPWDVPLEATLPVTLGDDGRLRLRE